MESARAHNEIQFRALQRRPTTTERQRWLRDALRPLGPEKTDSLFLPLDDLFSSILTDAELLHEDVDNPVEHHTTVLGHMIEIALGEHFDWPTIRIAAALSILHDNWPAKKVTRAMRREAKTPQEAAELEEKNLAYRTEHMLKGSENARRRLTELNKASARIVFDAVDIDTICDVIAIHDNPSIGRPIPASNTLAVAFREADRLWMLTSAGLLADLARKGNYRPTDQERLDQVKKNLESYEDERRLYQPASGGFRDSDTFFRTTTGYGIFLRYTK